MRRAAVTLAICAGALAAAGIGAAGADERRAGAPGAQEKRGLAWVAPVHFLPFPGYIGGGALRLTVGPREPAQIMAILVGLQVVADPNDPSGSTYLAAGRASCAELADDPEAAVHRVRPLGAPLQVAPDGTAVLTTESVWDDTDIVDLRKARSLAVVGDWNGDGNDGIGACGDVHRLRVVRDPARADGVFAGTPPLPAQTGDGLLLGNVLLTAEGIRDAAVAVTGLAPSARHDLGVSRASCDGAGPGPGEIAPVASFETDAGGAASLGGPTDAAGVGSDVVSVVVTRPGLAGPVVVRCEPLERLPVALPR